MRKTASLIIALLLATPALPADKFEGVVNGYFVKDTGVTSIGGVTNFSISYWFYPLDASYQVPFLVGDGDSTYAFMYMAYNESLARDLRVMLGNSTGNGAKNSTTVANVVTLNTWNFICVTFDGTTAVIFVNGVAPSQTPSNGGSEGGGARIQPTTKLCIGAYKYAGLGYHNVNGYVADMQVHKKILTTHNMNEFMCRRVITDTTTMQMNCKMDENGSGAVLPPRDFTGNNQTAVILTTTPVVAPSNPPTHH